jgi:hypothetical protein
VSNNSGSKEEKIFRSFINYKSYCLGTFAEISHFIRFQIRVKTAEQELGSSGQHIEEYCNHTYYVNETFVIRSSKRGKRELNLVKAYTEKRSKFFLFSPSGIIIFKCVIYELARNR